MKTAVEQFIEQLEKQGDSWENVSIGRVQISIKVEDYLKLKEQAKAMGKEQIEKAFEEGIEEMINRINSHTMCKHTDVSAEQYYNQTFKQQEQ
jgi:hypothetical protein